MKGAFPRSFHKLPMVLWCVEFQQDLHSCCPISSCLILSFSMLLVLFSIQSPNRASFWSNSKYMGFDGSLVQSFFMTFVVDMALFHHHMGKLPRRWAHYNKGVAQSSTYNIYSRYENDCCLVSPRKNEMMATIVLPLNQCT